MAEGERVAGRFLSACPLVCGATPFYFSWHLVGDVHGDSNLLWRIGEILPGGALSGLQEKKHNRFFPRRFFEKNQQVKIVSVRMSVLH